MKTLILTLAASAIFAGLYLRVRHVEREAIVAEIAKAKPKVSPAQTPNWVVERNKAWKNPLNHNGR